MRNVLITFLGRSKKKRGHDLGYPRANYLFSDGQVSETSCFGVALAAFLEIDDLIILGTEGSQWGSLVEDITPGNETECEAARIELLDHEEMGAVTQQLLDRVQPLMEAKLREKSIKTVTPLLIPKGKNNEEQIQILSTIEKAIPSHAEISVSIDVTHGFRHLSMLGFMSSFFLAGVKKHLEVKGLWYGALDMTGNDGTPVLKLDGLAQVHEWIDALHRFDATGDYGVFEHLLKLDQVSADVAGCLQKAAFYERLGNINGAQKQLGTFKKGLPASLHGPSGLYRKQLVDRLKWVDEKQRSRREKCLASIYLDRKDYVRAAIFAFEGFISYECEKRKRDPRNRTYGGDRQETKDDFKEELANHKISSSKKKAYYTLEGIRNSIAHASPPEKDHIEKLLKNEKELTKAIQSALEILFD